MNFVQDGEQTVCASTGVARDRLGDPGPSVQRWKDLIGSVGELEQPAKTHVYIRDHTVCRIDRWHIGSPSWIVRSWLAHSSVFDDPIIIHGRRLSDHTPVFMGLACARRIVPESRPKPAHICRSIRYVDIANQLSEWLCLDEHPMLIRWQLHKTIIREAGRLVRNGLIASETSGVNRAYALSQLCRALATQYHKRANILLQCCADARRFIEIEGEQVLVVNAEDVANPYDAAWRALTPSEIHRVQRSTLPANTQKEQGW